MADGTTSRQKTCWSNWEISMLMSLLRLEYKISVYKKILR